MLGGMTHNASVSLTKIQCRMARAALGWSAEQLGEHASVGLSTVQRFELGGSRPTRGTLLLIRQAFEAAGVVFIEDHGVSYREPAAGDDIEGGQ